MALLSKSLKSLGTMPYRRSDSLFALWVGCKLLRTTNLSEANDMSPQPITTLMRGQQLTLREISDRYSIAYEAVRERYYRAKIAART